MAGLLLCQSNRQGSGPELCPNPFLHACLPVLRISSFPSFPAFILLVLFSFDVCCPLILHALYPWVLFLGTFWCPSHIVVMPFESFSHYLWLSFILGTQKKVQGTFLLRVLNLLPRNMITSSHIWLFHQLREHFLVV